MIFETFLNGIKSIDDRLSYLYDIIKEKNKEMVMETMDSLTVNLTETNTIGKMLERMFIIMYPKIAYMVSQITYDTKKVKIIVVASDAHNLTLNVINACRTFYQKLHTDIDKN